VRDVVFAGPDRDDIAALVFPDIEACRRLAGLGADASPEQIVEHPTLRAKFAELMKSLAAMSPGSSTRVTRAVVMAEPPSMDKSEATDKGSINQRAVLKNRAGLVDVLYATPLSAQVIAVEGAK
jgi:feruloyl-CoA synthase